MCFLAHAILAQAWLGQLLQLGITWGACNPCCGQAAGDRAGRCQARANVEASMHDTGGLSTARLRWSLLFESFHSGAGSAVFCLWPCIDSLNFVYSGFKDDGEMKLRAVYNSTGSGVNDAAVSTFVFYA